MKEADMQTLVTGATGFVGSHLARLVAARGHGVRVLHRRSSKLDALAGLDYESALGDINDPDALRAACAGIDWVFHVAAVADYWRADKARMFEANVEGTRKVLQAAREAGVQRVIFTSSAAAVGLRSDGQPSDESVPFNLPVERFPYGYSKWLAEEIAREAAAQDQDVVIVNPVVVMGPGDLNMISGSFIVQMQRYQWLAPSTSGGVAVIDVRDVAEGHLAAAERGRSGERYILSAENVLYRDWFRLIAGVIGVAPPLLSAPDFALPPVAAGIDLLRRLGVQTPIDANQVHLGAQKVFFNPAKAWAELHRPQILMRQSVEETYRWYLENGYLRADGSSGMVNRLGRLLGQRPPVL